MTKWLDAAKKGAHGMERVSLEGLNVDWGIARPNRVFKGRPSQTTGAKLTVYRMKDGRDQACLTIYEDAMRRWRWVIGDRLEFAPAEYDGKPCVAVRRVPTGGYAISPASSEKGKAERVKGQSIAGNIRRACDLFGHLDGAWQPLGGLIDLGGVMVLIKEAGE